jgi:TonB family protein
MVLGEPTLREPRLRKLKLREKTLREGALHIRVSPWRCCRTAVWVAAFVLLGACASPNRPLQFLTGSDMPYPTRAKLAGIEGYVVVGYDVTADGTVVNARVLEADPPGVFDSTALEAVLQWRFRAPLENGERVMSLGHESTVTFVLGESGDYGGV